MALTDIDYLRYLLEDRIPDGGTDQDTFFTNSDLTDILSRNSKHIYASAASGWIIRAADYHRYLDTGDKKISQIWEHAHKMAKYYSSMVPDYILEGVISTSRVIGRAITLREYPEWMEDPGEDVQWIATR